jgi:hypothetical protein
VLFPALQATAFTMEDHPSAAFGLSFRKKFNYKLEYWGSENVNSSLLLFLYVHCNSLTMGTVMSSPLPPSDGLKDVKFKSKSNAR